MVTEFSSDVTSSFFSSVPTTACSLSASVIGPAMAAMTLSLRRSADERVA